MLRLFCASVRKTTNSLVADHGSKFRLSPQLYLVSGYSSSVTRNGDNGFYDTTNAKVKDEVIFDPPIPEYRDKIGETQETMKARLIYQSRKRGTLENGLLLSTFAARYLNKLTPDQLVRYDRLINKPSNDWDIYYWMVGTRKPPDEFNNDVMDMLREHAKNKQKESRVCQPALD